MKHLGILTLVCLWLASGIAYSQNLVNNPGLEENSLPGCLTTPHDGRQMVDGWYVAGESPDYLNAECYDEHPETPFWGEAFEIIYGKKAYGMVIGAMKSGWFISEAVATRIKEPIHPEYVYLFEYQTQYRGKSYSSTISDRCETDPQGRLGLYLGVDSLKVDVLRSGPLGDPRIVYTASSGKLIHAVPVPSPGQRLGVWEKISGCFTTSGGEEFLGVYPVPGPLEAVAPCEIEDSGEGFWIGYLAIDEINLYKFPRHTIIDTVICEVSGIEIEVRDLIPLEPPFQGATMRWKDTGSESSMRRFTHEGIYEVEITFGCGSTVLVTYQLSPLDCSLEVYAPTAFTPNGDGTNELFSVSVAGNIPPAWYELVVFDRWGRLIYQTNDQIQGWNGTLNGQPLPEGAYAWQLRYRNQGLDDRRFRSTSGTVVLMR